MLAIASRLETRPHKAEVRGGRCADQCNLHGGVLRWTCTDSVPKLDQNLYGQRPRCAPITHLYFAAYLTLLGPALHFSIRAVRRKCELTFEL
jgi:hypothetical protein